MTHPAEHLVAQYFRDRGLRPTPLKVGACKAPDLRVLSPDGRLAFYCEVKSVDSEDPFERLMKWAATIGSAPSALGGPDTTVSRLGDRIHQGTKQLRAANARREYPNVLAIVNNNPDVVPEDLRAALTGCEYTRSAAIVMYPEVGYGRLRRDLPLIDLFLWFDRPKHRLFHVFADADAVHHRRLCELIPVEDSKIRRVPLPPIAPVD